MSAEFFSRVLPSGLGIYTIFDMKEEELRRVEERLRPGAYAESGFLAENESLKAVCVRDLTTLNRLGISCKQISGTLIALIKKAEQVRSSNEVFFGERFKVEGTDFGTNGY